MGMKVICCGETLFDIIAGKKGPGDMLTFRSFPGGAATNTSMILSRLGVPVALISHLGTGFLSVHLINILKRKKVDTRYIIRDASFSSPLAFASIDKKGDSSYIFYEKAIRSEKIRPRLPRSLLKEAGLFHTGSYFSYSDTFFPFVRGMLKSARKNGLFITYDPNWRGTKIPSKKKARARIFKILPYVDLLKLSENDALKITGHRKLGMAIDRIQRYLNGALIITLGEKGSFHIQGGSKLHQPAFKVKVADTIGAGDGFTAGLIYRYTRLGREKFGEEMKNNLEFASAVSAVICSGHGATGALKNISQVRKLAR